MTTALQRVTAECSAQGVPLVVTDEGVLRRLAARIRLTSTSASATSSTVPQRGVDGVADGGVEPSDATTDLLPENPVPSIPKRVSAASTAHASTHQSSNTEAARASTRTAS